MMSTSGRSSRHLRTILLNSGCSSGAPPVMSSVVTDGEFARISRHLSATSLDMASCRRGLDSTWQWLQAWLQYRPMFNCKTSVAKRVPSQPACCNKCSVNSGAPSSSRHLLRLCFSSSVSLRWPSSRSFFAVNWKSLSFFMSFNVSSTNEPSAANLALKSFKPCQSPRAGLRLTGFGLLSFIFAVSTGVL